MPELPAPRNNAIEIIRPATVVARAPQTISLVAAEVDAETRIDFVAIGRRYIWLILLFLVLGAAGGFGSVILTTPLYRSRLMLEMQPTRNPMSSDSGGTNAVQEEAQLQTQMMMMRSGAFLKRVLTRMQTETLPVAPVRNDFFTKLRTKLRPEMRNSAQIFEDGVAVSMNTLQIRGINRTNLLEITSESIHPEIAANFVNTVGSEFIDQNLQSRSIDAQRTGQFLSSQVEETKLKLHEAEEKLQNFVRSSGNLFAAPDATLADSNLALFQGALNKAQADRIAMQSRYELFLRSKPEEVADLLEDPGLRTVQSRLAELRQQRNVLTMKFTPQHMKVQQVDVQIRDLEEQIRKEASAAVERIKNNYDSAVRQEKLLRNAHSGAAGQVSSQAGQAAQYSALKREVDILRETYGKILVQASQTSIASALPQNTMRVVDVAVPAGAPLKPNPPVNIAAGAFFALALSGGIIYLRERMDRSVKRPGSARELLNARELGVIPSIDASEPLPKNFRVRISLKSREVMKKALRLTQRRNPKELMQWQQRSFFAESFRHVMTSLLRHDGQSQKLQVVLMSSPNPSEGKTTVCANLAVCLAETGRRVLIVDADFRRPRVHNIFNLPNDTGLAQLLHGWDDRKAPGDLPGLLPTEFPNLSALVNGPEIEDLSRMLYSNRFSLLLEQLRQKFDIILIDAPPVLQIADTRILDQFADGVVLVLRSGVTDRKSALEAYRCLHEDGANILGTVLNDWQPSRKKTDTYYGYVRREESTSYAASTASFADAEPAPSLHRAPGRDPVNQESRP